MIIYKCDNCGWEIKTSKKKLITLEPTNPKLEAKHFCDDKCFRQYKDSHTLDK